MPGRQYVRCVPCAGFNDVLCQMERAWSYAERRGRILVVDARYSALQGPLAKFFRESHVLTVTDIPDTGGQALHLYTGQDAYAKNLAMLTDLFALARARRLFVTRLTDVRACRIKKGLLSGFSVLAQSLHNCREALDGLFADLPGDFLLPSPPRQAEAPSDRPLPPAGDFFLRQEPRI